MTMFPESLPCSPFAVNMWGPVPSPPPGWTWEGLMERALEEARAAILCGEIPVGAVVVAPDGTLLGSAHNQPVALSDPSAHAEMLAMRAAGLALGNYRLENCVLVVTLEPCFMCAGAAVHARLAGVVYGAADSKAGAVASCFNGLDLPFHNHNIWHMGGVSSQRCAELLQHFFAKTR